MNEAGGLETAVITRKKQQSKQQKKLPQTTTTPNSAISFWQNRTFCFDRIVLDSSTTTTITRAFGSGSEAEE